MLESHSAEEPEEEHNPMDEKETHRTIVETDSSMLNSKEFTNYIQHNGYHFTNKLAEWASHQMANKDMSRHRWMVKDCEEKVNEMGISIPNTSTIADFTYTANMAYADFYPDIVNERECLVYANMVANDPDGYEGIQFCRWLADVVSKKVMVPWGMVV